MFLGFRVLWGWRGCSRYGGFFGGGELGLNFVFVVFWVMFLFF